MMTAARRTRPSPAVSFSTLAKLMGPTTPAMQFSLLHGHKYPSDGPKRSYQNATKQAVDHVVHQHAFSPTAPNLRPWEREVVELLAASGIPLPKGLRGTRPSTAVRPWQFQSVEISVYPDVLLAGAAGNGALKFYLGKDALPRGVGAMMASLVHYHQTQVAGVASAVANRCFVYEPRASAIYHAGGNTASLLQRAQQACRLIVALWPTL